MSVQTTTFDLQEVVNFSDRKLNILTTSDVRPAELSDLEMLESLVNEDTKLLFGDAVYSQILDKSLISLCIENFDEEVVAFICFNDHPNVPSIPPWEWAHWLYNIYQLELITPRNTLWVHLAVWEPRYTYTFLKPLLKSIYAANLFLEYIIIVIPPGNQPLHWLEGHGTRIIPPGFSEPNKVQTLYLIARQHFVTKYKIRRAVEEDNDDLVPLIRRYSERLEHYYGEFYIAEILTRHPDCGRQIIVAEYAEHAVAILCLNETVNDELLNEAFELLPFYGLRKPHEDDEIEPEYLAGQVSALGIEPEEDHVEEETSITAIERKVEYISSLESEESDIEISPIAYEDSLDQFSIVNVSSIHLLMETSSEELSSSSSRSSDFSAVILSFNDYEMHLFADRSGLKSVSSDDLHDLCSKQMKNHGYVPKLPSLHGELNAFALEIAAAHSEHEVESLALLLEAAFECFPNRDYCVLSIPSTCPPFPLLKHFTRVTPRPVTSYPQELYVLHRNIVLSNMSVRIAVRSDITEVEELVKNMVKTGIFLNAFIAAVNEDDDYRAFVLLSEDQIVGVAVLKEEEDLEYLMSHYELIDWVNENHHKAGSHGLVEHLVLSPIFQQRARFFLREIHRLSDYSALYYCVFPCDTITEQRKRSICCVLSDFIAVIPRPKPEFTHTNLEGCAPADVVHRQDTPFTLYLSTGRHSSLPRYEINRKVVVVGSSDTAIAFLDSLVASLTATYYVRFTNISVISPHGIPYQKSYNRVRDMMFPRRSNFDYRYMHMTSLRTNVGVVNAVMTGIDRKNKLLILNDNNYLAYDLLFIMCGEQFQKPSLMSEKKEKKQKNKNSEFPENVFLINTETDATSALMKLKYLIMAHPKHMYSVIVYGFSLEAYCCLAALLEYGVPGANIIFVESFPIISENKFFHRVSHFNDGEVDETVQAAILAEGITVYPSYYFVDWIVDKERNRISTAKFESRYKKLNIDCIAMFMYNDKTVSARTFISVNQAGLVFDGGLVVGSDCRTNDPNIYAAGTITKYSRRFYADDKAHKYYNLEEIGFTLGQQMRKKLISFANLDPDEGPIVCPPLDKLVTIYKKPLMTYCCLPGNLRYLSVTKPGKQVPLEVAMSSDDYGQVLVTGDCKQLDKQGFFRLHLNQHGVVETITCLAKCDIDRVNLTALWGKHEKLLNNLQMRFEMVLITDLFDYFREPWCCAIFHDRFPLLEVGIKELLTSYTEVAGESLLEDLMRMFKSNDWAKLTFDQKEEVEEKFLGSPYHKLLEQKVLDFLRDNYNFLPMYAHPNIVRFLLQGYENSPMFEPQ